MLRHVGQRSDLGAYVRALIQPLVAAAERCCVVPFLHIGLLVALMAACSPAEKPATVAAGRPLVVPLHDAITADSAWTERPSFRVREWTIDDGLPTPVQRVAQTPDGYLWMATPEGLARFDGVRFVMFDTGNTPAFRSNDFLSVYAMPSGDLWAGTHDRWTYRLRGGEWTAFSIDEAFGGEHWVQGFAEDADGTIWALSTGPILAHFDGKRWNRYPIRLEQVWPPLAVDRRGVLWTRLDPEEVPGAPEARIGEGVVVRKEGDRFIPVEDPHLAGFTPTQYGPLLHRLVGAEADLGSGRRVRVDLIDAEGQMLTWIWFDGQTERAMLVDWAGRAWVQLENEQGGNLLVVVKDGQELARLEPEGATWFEQVFEDRQGSIWAFSTSTGLFQVTEDPFRQYTSEDGVPRMAVRTSTSADGGIIVSTSSDPDELRVTTIRDGEVQTDTYTLDDPPEEAMNRVRRGMVSPGHVVEDARGRRWGIAGPVLFRLTDGRAEVALNTHADFRTEFFRVIAPDAADPNVLWLGDSVGWIRRFDVEAGVVTDSVRIEPGAGLSVADPSVQAIQRAADGRLWVASVLGLDRIEEGEELRTEGVLKGRAARALADGPDGTLWVASDSGLVRVQDETIRVLSREHGLLDDDLKTVLLDDLGFLWAVSGQAILRLRLADAQAVLDGAQARLDVVTLVMPDGHLGASRVVWGAARADDSSLWIPSAKGVTRIDPLLFARQHARAPTPIPERITTEAGTSFGFASDLRLPVGERTLSLSYTAVDVLAPRHVRFQTRLDGHDEDWVDRGSDRRVVYGGLTPGPYRLWVRAKNAGGVWSEPVEAPAFVVPARPWETRWFDALSILALVLALVGGVRLRVRQLKRREAELSALVAERTEALRAEKRKTEQQAAQLLELDAAKSRFFANISHEFRTPLTLTLGPLEDLRAGLYGPVSSDGTRQLDLAVRNSRRLLRLVNQLLDVARIESGSLRLNLQCGELGAYVHTLAQPFVASAERRRVGFTVEISSAPLWVCFDADHLDKAIVNLLSNALKFTPEGGVIHLTVRHEGGEAVIAVRDTGQGIASEHRARLFERFFQGEKSEVQPGTGIGLALSKNLVELHGGSIGVESEMGAGSVFTIRLPLVEPSGEGASSEQTVAVAPGDSEHASLLSSDEASGEDRTTVLVVDDNADIRTYLRGHLERDGAYRVIEAENGETALAAVHRHLPDLIVSDVMMPRLDGFSLLAALRTDPETDFLPIILLTARAEAEDRLAGLGLGADDYVTKPFDAQELALRVDNLIAQRRRLRERFQRAPAEEAATTTLHPMPPDVASADDAFLDAVRVAIEAGLNDEDFGVDALAKEVGRSRSSLHQRLTELTDESPSALLRRMRLERAASLLERRVGTVSEIAYATGFKSVSHFSSSFGRHFGKTPTVYASDHPAASA